MKKAAFVLFSLFLVSTAYAQESQTTYNFLRVPMSAHAAALGGDNVSVIEDDEALVFHNPALLTSVSDKTLNLNYLNYMSGVNMLSVAFNKLIKERASVALAAQYVDYGKMKQTTAENVQIGEFSAKDIVLSGYFSYMLSDLWSGGISAKLLTSYIGGYNSLAMGIDVGINYYNPDKGWSASLVAKNMGGQLKAYDDNYESMPLDVQLGVSKRLIHTPLRFHATLVDLNHLNYKLIHHLVAGIDILFSDQVWVGAGYNFRRANEMSITSIDEESNHGAGFSCGAGINLHRLKINLAYGKYHVSSSSVVINAAYQL
ncbi:type IX secretion system protein PorQ [Hoylesella timonensis]|uniref:type IX secretion system protein PorQ n=1 Tax=Hoylesella timonensis TaxID=386414 RepID=UPI00336A20B7